MSARKCYLYTLAVLLLGCGLVRGQDETLMPVGTLDGSPGIPLPSDTPDSVISGTQAQPASLAIETLAPIPVPNEVQPTTAIRPPGRLSTWIAGTRPDCCEHIGGNGFISSEVFLRNGVSLPLYGPILARSLEPGWEIQGGGRVLFFNLDHTSAWTVEVALSNICNHGRGNVPVFFPSENQSVTISSLNRTSLNASLGRECYLLGKRSGDGPLWRVGWDVGGRYGSAKMEFNQITHRTDVLGGPFVALHTDWEFPKGPCIYQIGLRAQWDYTWMNILEGSNAQIMDLGVILTLGVRF